MDQKSRETDNFQIVRALIKSTRKRMADIKDGEGNKVMIIQEFEIFCSVTYKKVRHQGNVLLKLNYIFVDAKSRD